ncbi:MULTISPECIES: DUF4253 domain-containing protein [unclassified Kitasatospora]|uniref:DUF4253 domain-containing protein n=1 Tax=unclassified Kitasatospora TaxID=2633591 RepID=UPI00070ECEF9|nr:MULTISPECIES: DUF4253 domain-containing protein [unclassified Kitasatospora]KQV14288.1 hypothetical protein ASC99_31985 [Kitasatospora sp. Root107]KRB72378.1 hypothetical protein ASE03_22920 [Kitasatospora sp. Root187]
MDPELLFSVGTFLQPGRMITSDEGDGDRQPRWLSDGPAAAGLWARMRAEHARTGLWPLLLDSRDPLDSESSPWGTGELFPERMSSPDIHDPAELLAKWWKDYTTLDEDDDMLSTEERQAVTAPFGRLWPGLAPAPRSPLDPDAMAAEYAEHFASRRPQSRLGLVAAETGSEALTAAGWDGPLNYDNDTAKFSAVVRGWEQRFGARVVAIGPATLHLSVAAPPTTAEEALLVAAEHFAFCPDNIWQSNHPHLLATYAERLIGTHYWEFWWD